jgi:hypothetical protein
MSVCTYSANNTTIFYAVSVTCRNNVVRNRLASAMWSPTTSDFPSDATPHDLAIICFVFLFVKIYLQYVNTHTSVPDSTKLFLVNQFPAEHSLCEGSRCYLVRWWEVQQWKNGTKEKTLQQEGMRSEENKLFVIPTATYEVNLLAPEFGIYVNFSTPICKMRLIQEPKKVAFWNKRHFEEKNGEYAAC